MTFAAEFIFDHSDILLRHTLSDHKSAKVHMAYATDATNGKQTVFIYLVGYTNHSEFEASLESDETVQSWACLYSEDQYCSYNLTPATEFKLYELAAEMGILVEDVWSSNGKWHVQLLLPSRELLQQMRNFLGDTDVEFSLESLQAYAPEDNERHLTDGQFELLEEAYEQGYFRVPRGITQAELADRHGITESAVSQQIRRALERVLNVFFHGNSSG